MSLLQRSCTYSFGQRVVDGLAMSGNAPRIFSRTLSNGLPLFSIVFCALFGSLAYMGLGSANGSGKVFIWFQNSAYCYFLLLRIDLTVIFPTVTCEFVCSDQVIYVTESHLQPLPVL